jgi:hypothetical protein
MGDCLKDHNDFKYYYATPTKLIKNAFNILEQLLYHLPYLPQCPHPSTTHHPSKTLLLQHITPNHIIYPILYPPPAFPSHLPLPLHPPPPRYATQNLLQYPITSILNHKEQKAFNNNKILKKYTSYLCQWTLPPKWLLQDCLFSWKNPLHKNNNTLPLIQYYMTKQYTTSPILSIHNSIKNNSKIQNSSLLLSPSHYCTY